MAANPFAFDTNKNLYDQLKVPRNATSEDIQRAFKREARHLHPDKSGEHNTGRFQALVHARDTLLDKLKRDSYDDEHEDDDEVYDTAGALTCGPQLSEMFKLEFKNWAKSFIHIPRSSLVHFPRAFQDMLLKFSTGFLEAQCAKADPDRTKQLCTASTAAPSLAKMIPPLEDTANFVAQAATEVDVEIHAIAQIYKSAIENCGYRVVTPNDLGPIVDFSSTPKKQKHTLLKTLKINDPETLHQLTDSQLNSQILEYIPHRPSNYLRDSIIATADSDIKQCGQCQADFRFFWKPKCTCVACAKAFCKLCPLSSMRLYGYGSTDAQYICSLCLELFYQQHAKEWVNHALNFIQKGRLQDLKATFGCIQVALSLDASVNVISICRQLYHHNLAHLALPLALALVDQQSDPIENVKAYKLLSSIFKSLADATRDFSNRWYLLLAAKEAILKAASEVHHIDERKADIVNLQTEIDEVNRNLYTEKSKAEDQLMKYANNKKQQIGRLWASRNISEITSLLKASGQQDEYDFTLEALEQFLQEMEKFIPQMLPNDRSALLFFQGVLKLYKGRHVEGIADIEQMVWQAHSADILKNEAIQIMLSLPGCGQSAFRLDGLQKIFTQKHQMLLTNMSRDYTDGCLRENQLVMLDEGSISPPFKSHWPTLSVIGLNLRAHRKCEAAFVRQFEDKKWGAQDVAFAYIDYVQGCMHPAERALSLLHASMWFLKDLKTTKKEPSERFALKKLIMSLLGITHVVARKSLHPGMQLYVGRLGLGIVFQTLETAKTEALPEDTELINALLNIVTYSSRFVPFWSFPSVPVSEAALLSIISSELHCTYLEQLAETKSTQKPITEAELRYQQYENDLRYVHRAGDPKAVQLRAMTELLSEKGWTIYDVADLMTSPLSPRDKEGWLIQQPRLGIQQEYAEVKGMRLNLDSQYPSIELVVVPANDARGRMGTCSQIDFQHVLSMVVQDQADGTLFFSLEQPDNQQRFHPFQEFKYTTETLHKSDLLHTLFETDYLLKSFSVGTEVSAQPPFNQRPNKAGLTKNLPKHLKEKLKPVSDRGAIENKAHRFWIQADQIEYSEEQTNSQLEVRLGEMDMVVRSHPLIPGKDGKLIDTNEDEDPDSPEAKFAADMTQVYGELGLHFPMFTRLKQLAKLQVLGLFLRGILAGMKEKSKGIGITIPDSLLHEVQSDALQNIRQQIHDNLASISSQIGVWPEAEDRAKVSSEVERVLRELPYHVYATHSDVEPHVIRALRTRDASILSQVVDALMSATSQRLNRNTLTSEVRDWLQDRSSQNRNSLANYVSRGAQLPTHDDIKRQIVSHYKQRYTAFSTLVRRLAMPNNSRNSNPCKWVPAALRKEEDGDHLCLCYGGVLIAPKIKEGRVPQNLPHSKRVPVGSPQYQTTQSNPSSRITYSSTQTGRRQTSTSSKTQSQRGTEEAHTSPTSSTSKQSSKWNFSNTQSQKQVNWVCPGKQSGNVFRLFASASSNSVGGSGDIGSGGKGTSEGERSGRGGRGTGHGSGTRGGGGQGGRGNNWHRKLAITSAVAVAAIGTVKLVQTFGNKEMRADSALKKVLKDSNKNPLCQRPNCTACANNMPPVRSFTTSAGVTYKTTGIPVKAKNAIYMIECKKTGKMYIGMTTRSAVARISEHLRGIVKQKGQTVAKHFNDIGCLGQFEEHMNISTIACVSQETMKSYTQPQQRRRIMEYIEAKLMEVVGRDRLLNKNTPCTSFHAFERPPDLDSLIKVTETGIYIDGQQVLTV